MTEILPNFPSVIDSTMLNEFRACPRKFFHSFCLNLAPAEKSVDLHFGGAIAAAMEAGRKAFYLQGLSEEQAETVALNAALHFWGDYESPPDSAKSFDGLIRILNCYFSKWPFSTDEVKPALDGKAIEISFAFPLDLKHPTTGKPILYAGRFDMIGEFANELYVVDEKTMGKTPSSSWADTWSLRSQFIGYSIGANNLGYRCDKVLVRGLSILKTQESCTQAIKTYPDHIKERWLSQLDLDVARMVASFVDEHFDWNFGDACSAWGRPCSFMPLCTAKEPSEWYSLYAKRNWNPLHKDQAEAL